MSLLNVYVCKDVENVQYEIRKKYKGKKVSFYYCDMMDFPSFSVLHQKSLLPANEIRCFFNVDSLDKDKLLDLVSYVDQEVVWSFSSLPKSRKLYKKISKFCKIENPLDLSKSRDKTTFVKRLIREYKIDKKFTDFILKCAPDDKLTIDSELFKFATALKTLPEDKAVKVIGRFEANYDLLNFMNCMFSNPNDAYMYAEKVAKSSAQYGLAAMLTKRLKYYILLSLDEVDQATKYWNASGYFLQKNKEEAKNIGFHNLLKLYNYIDNTLTDFYDLTDLEKKLKGIVYEIERL